MKRLIHKLTLREREVLMLLGEQKASRDIAEQLSVSVRTVEKYRGSISAKLGLESNADFSVLVQQLEQ